jgi:hypothetical protein
LNPPPPPTTEKMEKYCSKSQVMLGWRNNEISSNDTVSVCHREGQINKICYKFVLFIFIIQCKILLKSHTVLINCITKNHTTIHFFNLVIYTLLVFIAIHCDHICIFKLILLPVYIYSRTLIVTVENRYILNIFTMPSNK